jgi:hypothetical protein
MQNSKSRSFPFCSFSKKILLGTDGINGALIPATPGSVHSENTWNAREWSGTDEYSGGNRNE